jgi:hypothetical protein
VSDDRLAHIQSAPVFEPTQENSPGRWVRIKAEDRDALVDIARLMERVADGKCLCGGEWTWTGVQTRCSGCDRVRGWPMAESDRKAARSALARLDSGAAEEDA